MSTTISYAIVDGSNKLINLSDYCVNTNVFSKSAFYVDGDSRPVFNPSIYFEGTDTMMVSDLPSECDLSARGKGRGITELHREDEPVYVLTRVDYIHLNEVFKACRKMEEARAEYVRLLGYTNFYSESGTCFSMEDVNRAGANLVLNEHIQDMVAKAAPLDAITMVLWQATESLKEVYSTMEAQVIFRWNNGDKFSLVEETLYRNSDGNWFVFGESSADKEYSNLVFDGWCRMKHVPGQAITPLSFEDALEWMEYHHPGSSDRLEKEYAADA